MQQNISMCS